MSNLKTIIDKFFITTVSKSGFRLFLTHNITDLSIDGNSVSVFVGEINKNVVKVKIDFDDNKDVVRMECNCTYPGNCKHLVAVLYEMEKKGFFIKSWSLPGTNGQNKNQLTPARLINILSEKLPDTISKEETKENNNLSKDSLSSATSSTVRQEIDFNQFKSNILLIVPKKEAQTSKARYKIAFALVLSASGRSSHFQILRQRLLKDGLISDMSFIYDVNFDNVEPLSLEERLVINYLARVGNLANPFGTIYYQNDKRTKQTASDIFCMLADKEVYLYNGSNPPREIHILKEKGHCDILIENEESNLNLRLNYYLENVKIESAVPVHDDPLWVLSEDKIFQIPNLTYTQFLKFGENKNCIKVPRAYLQYFEESILPGLSNNLPINSTCYSIEELEVNPVWKIFFEEQDLLLRIRLKFGYGEIDLPCNSQELVTSIFSDNKILRVTRNKEIEAEALSILNGLSVKVLEEGVVVPKNNPLDFLYNNMTLLKEQGFAIFGEADLKKFKVNSSKPKVAFAVSSGVDWFDLETNVNFDGIPVSFSALVNSIKQKKRYLELSDGSYGILPAEWVNKFMQTISLGEVVNDGTIRFSKLQANALDVFLGSVDSAERDKEFEEHIVKLNSFERIKKQSIPKTFKGELREYQKAGVDWLYFLREFSFGGILADDMGLGKTIQVLALLAKEKLKKKLPPTLIVAPTSVVFNWINEAAKFVPSLKILNHTGTSRIKEDHLHFEEYDVVLTSYGILLRDFEIIFKQAFHYIILDESQKVKNPTSKTARLMREFKSSYRLCLTGTPVENNLNELWSQMNILNYGMLGTLKNFQDSFVNPIQRENDQDSVLLLRKMIYPFILRRTKELVAKELPPKTEITTMCQMEPEQEKIYNIWKESIRAEVFKEISKKGIKRAGFKIIEGLLRLRQICNHPVLVKKDYLKKSGKFEEFKSMLIEVISEEHKVLVFSQFVQMLEIMKEFLVAENIPFEYLRGSTINREERVNNFQNNKNIKVFLISLKAGGFGLNLTAADYVFHYDPWWNPAVEQQATDRAHRIGQDKNVFVYKFITKNSVEEKILQLQEKKRTLAKNIISTEAGVLKNLSKEDISLLFD